MRVSMWASAQRVFLCISRSVVLSAAHDTQHTCASAHAHVMYMYFYYLSFWEILGCSRFWIIIIRSPFGARTPLTLAHALVRFGGAAHLRSAPSDPCI